MLRGERAEVLSDLLLSFGGAGYAGYLVEISPDYLWSELSHGVLLFCFVIVTPLINAGGKIGRVLTLEIDLLTGRRVYEA